MLSEHPQADIKTGKLAILLQGGMLKKTGKTGLALLRFSEAEIVAVIDQEQVGKSVLELTGINRHIPIVGSVREALSYQPTILMIGIAPSGGALPEEWWSDLDQAVKGGLSIANGLHTHLVPALETRYQQPIQNILKPGQWIWDIRQEPPGLGIGSAAARTLNCRRVLAVGTDMSIGKMSTCIKLNEVAVNRGLKSKFLATGQAGLMLGGDGIPLDSIRIDFAAGAVEQLVMKYGKDYEILLIEGQGSFIHPGSTATLPLIRGSQPTHLILVHKAKQTHIHKHPHIAIPPLTKVIQMYEIVAEGAGAFSPVKVAAISLNTYGLTQEEAKEAIAQIHTETGLPCTDPVRFGVDLLLDAVINN